MKTVIQQSAKLPIRYDVIFTRNLFAEGNETLANVLGHGRKLLVFVDQGVLDANPSITSEIRDWSKRNPNVADLVAIEPVLGGEAVKNNPGIVDWVGGLTRKHGICRHSFIAAIGGGAVLDAVGYAAAVVHRGIRLIRIPNGCGIPTTTLSQNDSGVGVKNGINRFGVKNFYGVFAPPYAVLNDLNFLDTLSDRVWYSGISEAFKVACIKDIAFLDYLIDNAALIHRKDPVVAETIMIKTAELHINHIGTGGDPFESGSSRPLDFGHWSAHKLEAMTNFKLLHGEAVSIGLALDLHYAALCGLIEMSDAERITNALRDVGLPISHEYLTDRFDDIWGGLDEFREHLGGQLTLSMPQPLGSKVDIHVVDKIKLQEAIALINNLQCLVLSS